MFGMPETPIALIVTTHPDREQLLMATLQGQQVTASTAGVDQLPSLLAHITSPLVVVMDLSTCCEDERYDVLEHVRSATASSGTPILAIVPPEVMAEAPRVLSAGADDFILDPVDSNELLIRLEALVHRRR